MGAEVEFGISLTQAFLNKERGNKPCIIGIASDNLPDKQSERISKRCMGRWVEQCRKGIDILDNHRATFGFGKTYDAVVKTGAGGESQFEIHAELDFEWPQAKSLFSQVTQGSCDKEMSIGGLLDVEDPECFSYEMKEDDAGIVRVLNSINLDHVATTRRERAANPRTGFSSAIMKSLEGDSGGSGPGRGFIEVITEKTSVEEGKEHAHKVQIALSRVVRNKITFARPVITVLGEQDHHHAIASLTDSGGVTTDEEDHSHSFDVACVKSLGVSADDLMRAAAGELNLVLKTTRDISGVVESEESPHDHSVVLVYDLEGNFLRGACAEVQEHTHEITEEGFGYGGTEEAVGHTHSFDPPSVDKDLLQTSAAESVREGASSEDGLEKMGGKGHEYAYGRSSADPVDGHMHALFIDHKGNGQTMVSGSPPHSHVIKESKILPVTHTLGTGGTYTSRHPGEVSVTDRGMAAHLEFDAQEAGLIEKPYSGPEDTSLPDNIQKLPEEQRKKWVGAFNGAFQSCMSRRGAGVDAEGDSLRAKCESFAFATANNVIKEAVMPDNEKMAGADLEDPVAAAVAAVEASSGKSADLVNRGAQFLEDVGRSLTLKEETGEVEEAANDVGEEASSVDTDAEGSDSTVGEETGDTDSEGDTDAPEKAESDEAEKSVAEQAVELVKAMTQLNLSEEDRVTVKKALADALQEMGGMDVAENFLTAAESFKEHVDSVEGRIGTRVEKHMQNLVGTMVEAVEKVGQDASEVKKSLENLTNRVAEIEKIEGGSGGMSGDSEVVAKSEPGTGDAGVFRGLFSSASRQALAKAPIQD